MARPPKDKQQEEKAQQEVFMREVDEAVRQEDLLAFWKKYGKWIAIALGVFILGMAGWMAWSSYRSSQEGAQGEAMTLALDAYNAGDYAKAEKQLSTLAADADPGYTAAATMLRANIALKTNKQAEAIKLLQKVADTSDAPEAFRNLALIRVVSMQFDTMNPADVITKLKPLVTPGTAWFGSAGELVGFAYVKQGKTNLAGPLFASIAKDETVSPTLRRRARQEASVLGADTITDPNKTARGTDIKGDGPPPAPQGQPGPQQGQPQQGQLGPQQGQPQQGQPQQGQLTPQQQAQLQAQYQAQQQMRQQQGQQAQQQAQYRQALQRQAAQQQAQRAQQRGQQQAQPARPQSANKPSTPAPTPPPEQAPSQDKPSESQ